ncbi:DEAD-box ATP-dependent RNA helicase CshA [Pseudonocardia sulfidoxydans NBRC 16205]|uniref:RNA helicase n=1 Tax=Pseudonocardia sulfidoxydans NBRC 16205 TaxID=1223511 RepID=A0A511DAR5_9PSEU|nr:DEAD/DEAH box helicase [Pseudonocardia sulfidoxydans]GEL21463.1 DEAD-box ATP-dependent RNA helicase CshA [Pseudonocardia sulfidoxydans NBRC 16205]
MTTLLDLPENDNPETPELDDAALAAEIDSVEELSSTDETDLDDVTDPADSADDGDADDSGADAADSADADDSGDADSDADSDDEGGVRFADLGLAPAIQRAIDELGYERPSPIQAEAIPSLIDGRDLIGQAATGTGKTAAFALPMLQRLAEGRSGHRGAAPLGLVLAPTRELAMQVTEAVARYGKGVRARVLAVYGGAPIGPQLGALKRGVDIVVATPGRAIDLINRGALSLDQIEVVVLDEADEMLDMGFVEDIETILQSTPDTRQAVLFSATMPRRIEMLARTYLTDPVMVRIQREEVPEGEAPRVRQTAYMVPRTHTTAALGRILELERPTAAIVFCRTRADVDAVTEALTGRGLRAEALHGGMDQEHRTRVVDRLRNGRTDLLVATDVAARGLDIDTLTHVVNHDVPKSPESYVHRIGRVGRAGREGVAITLVAPASVRHLRNIERLTGTPVPVAPVPTVADLAASRVERTKAALRERLLADRATAGRGADDGVAAMIAALAGEFDAIEVAAAAVRIARDVSGAPEDEIDIPVVGAPREGRRDRDGRGGPGGRRDREFGGSRGQGPRPPRAGTTRLFVSAGRAAGVRPQDIVGALANESRLSGRDIGAIQIHERHALVEVPEHAADDVLRSLRGVTTLKGRRANVRRDRAEARS